ncbi:MAG TPA: hypothetical protein VG733_04965 [Chthoniobacteraceae bacterium]|nr:hypothetical protein [Chthoniobacteraceae bacterium]
MLNEDSFQYAIENTQVLFAPESRIETFGNTRFRFYVITELMDRANQVRVRNGYLHAERPQIIAPGHYAKLLLEGFGEKGREFAQWLEQNMDNAAVLKYGMQFKRTDGSEDVLHCTPEEAFSRIKGTAEFSNEPLNAVLQGVDEAWEVSLLKFSMDLIRKSAPGNMGDFRERGLL